MSEAAQEQGGPAQGRVLKKKNYKATFLRDNVSRNSVEEFAQALNEGKLWFYRGGKYIALAPIAQYCMLSDDEIEAVQAFKEKGAVLAINALHAPDCELFNPAAQSNFEAQARFLSDCGLRVKTMVIPAEPGRRGYFFSALNTPERHARSERKELGNAVGAGKSPKRAGSL